jgi:hypothetical protein
MPGDCVTVCQVGSANSCLAGLQSPTARQLKFCKCTPCVKALDFRSQVCWERFELPPGLAAIAERGISAPLCFSRVPCSSHSPASVLQGCSPRLGHHPWVTTCRASSMFLLVIYLRITSLCPLCSLPSLPQSSSQGRTLVYLLVWFCLWFIPPFPTPRARTVSFLSTTLTQTLKDSF